MLRSVLCDLLQDVLALLYCCSLLETPVTITVKMGAQRTSQYGYNRHCISTTLP